MAYEHNWNPKDKLTYEQMEEFLTTFVVEHTENTFAIKKSSDDGGAVIEIYVEEGIDGDPPRLPPKCRGWRVVWCRCPEGYIEAFNIRRK